MDMVGHDCKNSQGACVCMHGARSCATRSFEVHAATAAADAAAIAASVLATGESVGPEGQPEVKRKDKN